MTVAGGIDETLGWTGTPRALLETAIRRHGGWDAWTSLRTIVAEPRSLSGMVPWLKGYGRTFPLPARVEIEPVLGRATFFGYPSPGATGTFDRGRLTLTDAAGAITAATDDGRAWFRGWRKLRRWSPQAALYFFGYAFTHYHSLPFTLGQGRLLGLHRVRHEGRTLKGLHVELPVSLHTHCRRQTFYFEEDGLLRRHDYVAEVVGRWARGAHLWDDFVTVAGVEVARVRHVVARLGRRVTPFVALHAELTFL